MDYISYNICMLRLSYLQRMNNSINIACKQLEYTIYIVNANRQI